MKPGTEYELYVQQVYQMLVGTDLKDCKVRHNVMLKGHGGIEHQIDVYWEFTIAGVLHRTAIECKDYNRNVSKEKIAAFRAVLDDIGGIRGIYATKVGYQSGAREFAKQHDIDAMIIRPPEEQDWDDRVREVHIQLIVTGPTNVKPQISIDSSRLDPNTPSIPIGLEMKIESAEKVELHYEEMKPAIKARTMQDLVSGLPRSEKGATKLFSYEFENGIMVSGKDQWPITKIMFEYETSYSKHELVIKVNDEFFAFVQNVLKNQGDIVQIGKQLM